MPKLHPQSYKDTSKQPNRQHVTLYRVTLQAGTVYRFADFDTDVTANIGGAPFLFQAFGHKRDVAHTRLNLQVDSMDISIPNVILIFAGQERRLSEFVLAGALDNADIELFKWDAENPLVDAVAHSAWVAETATFTSGQVKLQCLSPMAQVDRQVPRTIYQELCNNQLYDEWCGVARASFEQTATVLAGSTDTVVKFSQNQLKGYYDFGEMTFVDGANAGLKRTIKKHSHADTEVATGKAYTKSHAPHASFPDTGNVELTDLIEAYDVSSAPNVGWDLDALGTETITVRIDLGSALAFDEFVTSHTQHPWDLPGSYPYRPQQVEFQTSPDDSAWTSRGTVTFSQATQPDPNFDRWLYKLVLGAPLTFRYVRAIATRQTARAFMLWSEFFIRSYPGVETVTLIHPALVTPAVGDTIKAAAGCDKRLSTCKVKFSNLPNFRGFPTIPKPTDTL
jgi:hypothetical protein